MILYRLFSTIAFGMIFNVPKRALPTGGVIGMLGWVLYNWLSLNYHYDIVAATLISTLFVAIMSQLLARFQKIPVTVFSISGIIPLVPGGLAYETMRNFVENEYSIAIKLATKTLLLSGAIAFGLIISGVISQTIKRNDPIHDQNRKRDN
ncbi:threonine/serine exporter family protein [Tepidibacillus marianensis]|uniref:threonine/serine exporter family protein n=1 Tax=Tepidibacillus marianensis TaxID=3131995 RepID=UPI00386B06D0